MRKLPLILVCLYCFLENVKAQTIDINNVRYSFSGAYAAVSKYLGGEGVCTIPEKIEYNDLEYIVTAIGSEAFRNKLVTEVKLPETIRFIYSNAFYSCSKLSKINLSSSLTLIGAEAFRYCGELTQLIIPEYVSFELYGSGQFAGCNTLRTLIYLAKKAPKYWTATSFTYVPDIQSYSSPQYSINNAQVIEMITFNQTEFDYTGQAPTPTWTNNVEGYTALLSLSELSGEVGNHEEWVPVTFTKNGESFTTNVVYRYTIKPTKLTAKVENVSREYGEDNPQFNIVYSGFKNGDNESNLTSTPIVSTPATRISNVGEYPITISGGASPNYTIEYETGVLTITKAPLSAKVNDATKVYGSNNPSFSIEYYGLKNGETVPAWTTNPSFQTSAIKSSSVGQYAVNAINGVPKNYDLGAITPGTLTISPAPLTIKANNATRQYYDENPTFGYTCSGFVNGEGTSVLSPEPTLSTSANMTSNVGTYVIMPSGAVAQNYNITYEQGELTITKRPLEVTSHFSRQYGEENPLLPIEYSGFVNNENESVLAIEPVATTTAQVTSSVGNYQITITGGEAVNYYFVYKQGVLTVTKAPLSAKVNDVTKVYGSNNPSFTMEYFGLRNNETLPTWTTQPTYQTSATKSSGVGQYEVNVINAVPKNYDLGEITPGTLFVTPASLTIRANNASRQYYSENPTFSYTCSGFVNSDNNSVLSPAPIFSTTANLTSNVGTYPIEIGGASSPNYTISYVNGTLSVTQRTLMASVGNYQRVYNEDNPEFEVVYSGFVGGDNEDDLITKPAASTSATKTSNVGTYTINVSGGNDDNYKFSYTSGTLTVNKAEQTISWNQDLSGLEVGDQVELQATASSGLPITYTMDTEMAELYSTGNKTYLDCLAGGQFLIRAVQNGNNNYYSSPRASKSVTIIGNDSQSDPTLTINQADNGTISMQVSRGKSYTFTIVANYGWKIHSVMFNNSDVTNKLNGNKYTTPAITGDSWLSVVYERIDEDAISYVPESNVKILGTPTGARVIGAEIGDIIRVYTTDGKLQHTVEADNNIIDIPLTKDEIYIIQVGTKTVKLGH